MKFKFAIGSLLILMTMSSTINAQIDANQAISELSLLQESLNQSAINERTIKNTREKAIEIRTDALICVNQIEPQVETLKLEVEALEQISPDVDIQIYERLSEARSQLTAEDATLKNCSLTVVRSTRIIDRSNKLLNELTTELLSEKSEDILDAIASLPAQFKQLPDLFFNDKAIQRISKETLFLLVLFLILGFSFGYFFGDQIKKIQYSDPFKSIDRSVILKLRALFKPFGRVQSPILFGSLGVSAAIALSMSISPSESWIIRLGLSPFLASAIYLLINWITGPFSPADTDNNSVSEAAKNLKQKLNFFTLIVIITYIVFGPDWLASDLASDQPLMRIVLVSLMIFALIPVLNRSTSLFMEDGQYGVIKFIGYSALALSFISELSGFHNLSNFILSGFILTLFSTYFLWSLLALTENTVTWINESTNLIGIRIRSALDLTRDSGKSKLAIYQLFFDASFWIVYLSILIRVWDPTGTLVETLSSYATDGIPMGDIRVIPTNILAGIIAFTILAGLTGWIKRWIDKRWLRQITPDRGAREALVTVVGYTGFTISILVGLSISGANITGIAVVAGALSVGIGFGLQAIANNFVSGIILLFERPIKSGDFVSVGDVEGFVKKISIRATEIETLDNQDMLIPNSELISGRVTNWVLHNPYGRLIVKIGVAYGSDIEKVASILEETANQHEMVISDGRASPPKALFMGFGDSSLDFELRVRIVDIKRRYDVLSDLNFAINQQFASENIVIPFPQRDLHIRDWTEDKKKKK
ncbi:MAG: mechanosensitive ion channel [Gammaproteobacteria bacterium]|jgi:small-conductance mechanosensitive channel|nr:mechanosensitive ion channel [Gammaproteobacteria bacterium]HJL80561.1 mechanosensitive ion channel [Gammaproteobacteria bacterium]HJM09513.1 mechanosensitive ion channel [Gammaproteobacteria bacterium]HJN00532.1 mechanosensitive ion channel [Gammaproteobacteria bacterium]|tara:strand:- start:600 stop:2894 length:2295 start_codon:yes stop_codon:yes gene_type:complete